MISEMAAVEILGPVEVFHDAVELIQQAGALHIVETPLAEYGRAGLLEKMHLTDNEAEEREACARTAGILDEMVADIPAYLLRAPGAVGQFAVAEYQRLARLRDPGVGLALCLLHEGSRPGARLCQEVLQALFLCLEGWNEGVELPSRLLLSWHTDTTACAEKLLGLVRP